ncbi:potassium voltage-gated channel subfamily H member 6 isoform X3 [Nematostella vectensis]|uniref:potassium voltage-gated channel subfamily H member 6 isoform X3 n=1 Tax=Nematostella vectensis TaxID=45351 RepID=UPI00138FA8A0|nr:potassium voltage-gated channel subfamily H member 6 isoform X3 [Nematostella vectensis]XP_048589449.1 potassium voltage-gated channel subfamily H member 6 isoform X3 [Nematostella vectensis]XP_048589450.1 potassium voltage-gated channel subfamily H member 6 isoform X3 [Nematostella vectensis]
MGLVSLTQRLGLHERNTAVMAAFKRWRARYKRYKLQIPPQMRNRIILHYGLFKITWDWLIMVLVLYTAVEVPFVSAFIMSQADLNKRLKHPNVTGNTFERMKKLYPDAYPLLLVDTCIDVIFMLDIVLNFRTTYVKEGEVLITNPCKIGIHYLRSYFIVDFVAAIPWELLLDLNADENTTLFSLLKTARLLRLFRAARKLDRNYEYMTSLLFLMLMFFMLVAHWMACIWYMIGFSEQKHKQTSWLSILATESNKHFHPTDPWSGPYLPSRYLTSLYYVMTLCTTVGFGNVSANTDGERIFTICGMLLGAVMYAGIFGNVTAIIHGQYSSNFRYRKESMAINEFVRFYKIRNPLARRLREYSRHTWSQTKGTDMNRVLKKFPEGLQYEIRLHMHLTVLSNSFLFMDSESSCLRGISMRMRRQYHLPGHFIMYEGDEVDTLHLIKRGKIEIIVNGVCRGRLVDGDAYGTSLRQAGRRPKSVASLRAATCVDCHVIKIEELDDVMQSYPSSRARLLTAMDDADTYAFCEEEDLLQGGQLSPAGTLKGNHNGEVHHMILEENSKEKNHFSKTNRRKLLARVLNFRPVLGCRRSDATTSENTRLSTEHELALNPQPRNISMNQDNESHGRFVNITDLSAIRTDTEITPEIIDEFPENQAESDLEEETFEEAPEPLLSDINENFVECSQEAHERTVEMGEKYREMSRDIKRLENKVDTLIALLSQQQKAASTHASISEPDSPNQMHVTSV